MRAGSTRRELLVGGAAVAAAAATLGCRARAVVGRGGEVREAVQIVDALASRDGAGVALRRSLGSGALPMVDPFLLLDEIHSDRQEDWIAGFPEHPHRGFETVSYVLRGAFEHRDSVGNHGRIADGGAQWMTAGRGLVHAEMPSQQPGLDLWGLQLWVNLPAAQKWVKPRYQDLGAAAIPELDVADARVRLIAGRIGEVRGPVDGINAAPTMLDATLAPGATFRQAIPGGHAAFIYVLGGELQLGVRGQSARAGQLAVLSSGTDVVATSAAGGRGLLLAAAPIGEPVARRGPFVMNTEAELDQAFADYRSGRLAGG